MTKETMPRHIWMHEVELAAIKAGANSEDVRAVRRKAFAWYNAGEPVWMAADGLKQLAAGLARARREDADGRTFIRAARGVR